MDAKLSSFLGKAAKAYGEGALTTGGSSPLLRMARFSSGVFTLDYVLGGGYPFGRIVLLHGSESSGKTTLALKACASVARYARGTRRLILGDDPGVEYCRALYVDIEGHFDPDWADLCGFDRERHVLARAIPTAEDAVDLITAALEENLFDLIVLDSIAMMQPSKEIEGAAEKDYPGLHARLMNKAFRKWGTVLNKQGKDGAALLCINQERQKIGVMFGDPTTLPGGQGQLFACSIRAKLHKAHIKDDEEEKMSAYGEYGGTTPKNKTFTPHLEFSYKMAVRDHGGYKKGEVMNEVDLVDAAKRWEILTKGGHEWDTGMPKEDGGSGTEIIKVKTMDDMVQFLHENPLYRDHLWKIVLEKALV